MSWLSQDNHFASRDLNQASDFVATIRPEDNLAVSVFGPQYAVPATEVVRTTQSSRMYHLGDWQEVSDGAVIPWGNGIRW